MAAKKETLHFSEDTDKNFYKLVAWLKRGILLIRGLARSIKKGKSERRFTEEGH